MLEERVAEWTREWLAEGAQRILARQLQLKFGSLDASTRARIEGADSETLLRWAERVLVADQLGDVFA